MKHFRLFSTCLLVLTGILTNAQTKSTLFTIPKAASVNMSDIKEDWNPVVQNIEAPFPGVQGGKMKLAEMKDSLSKVYPRKNGSAKMQNKMPAPPAPFLGQNFQGNLYNSSTPNDNDVAVSNGNKLISVQNATVFRYDINTGVASPNTSLGAFASVLANPYTKYDPKVIYDPIEDKFILVFLNGFTDTTSSITVAFSTSNDPAGSWNMYELPGNPFNNGLWTDYPMLAMTEKEVFITGNLLYPDSSWQTGFNETVIWQVNKNSGYTGVSLSALVHHNITCVGKPVRNLCPVKGGLTSYGPDMNFLSDRNLDPVNDTVFLVNINDTLGAAGQIITVTPLIAPVSYFMAPPAQQPGPSGPLETNDSRMLGAFIENDKIQYVHNCLDTATGNCAVYHGIIHDVSSSPYITSHIISDTVLEVGYPNISYAGVSSTDNSAIINFDHSALTVFPGVSALTTDGSGNYSPFTIIKSSTTYLSVLTGNERWGDYSGSQRKYNQPGRVWVNGLYANGSKKNATWVAELAVGSLLGVSEQPDNSMNALSLYPNPTTELMNVTINVDRPDVLHFEVLDVNGKLIKVLLRDKVKAGVNNFSFSTAPLANGIYFLKVSSASKVILTQKFVKQ